jgi:Phage tail baseplate hub (GPD)
MFNYITVNFPETTIQPQVIYSATISQKRYSHELACLYFKDWGVQYDAVRNGSPVHLVIRGLNKKRDFYGYVHHIKLNRTPGKNFTEVTVIGASFPMKQQRQAIYKNTTADQVVQAIATKYNFAPYTIPHPRVYPQISQTAHSDWELMVRLAKQCGYTLRATNTELYFEPIMYEYTNYRTEAPKFIMRTAADPDGSTLYSFKPLIGEALPYEDAIKGAIAVNGVDVSNVEPISITQQIRNLKIRKQQQLEFFDRFDTSTVALDVNVANFEAEAAENRNYFPYRAKIEVLGNPNLHPDMPIYLDGLGAPYSGYWVILETEHNIIEEELNRQRYTTTLTVGTDSLGDAAQWTDSQTVLAPNYEPKRTIIPNIRQTKIQPTTILNKKVKYDNSYIRSSFGEIENRAKPNINGRTNAPSMWQTDTITLNQTINETYKPKFITHRIAQKMGII